MEINNAEMGGTAGSFTWPPQTPTGIYKVENPSTGNAVSDPAFVFSAARADTDPDLEQEIQDPKLRRILSNRYSARRSREKRRARVADLETDKKFYEEAIIELQPKHDFCVNHTQAMLENIQTLNQEIEEFTNHEMLIDAEYAELKGKMNWNMGERATKVEKLLERLRYLNIDVPQEPLYNYPISSYYTNLYPAVAGNGAGGTSYIPEEPVASLMQQQILAEPNFHEMNLSFPNYMGSDMDQTNLASGTAPNHKPH